MVSVETRADIDDLPPTAALADSRDKTSWPASCSAIYSCGIAALKTVALQINSFVQRACVAAIGFAFCHRA